MVSLVDCLFIHSCIKSFIDAFIHSFVRLFIHACMHESVSNSFIHSFINSFLHSFTPSFLHSFVHGIGSMSLHWHLNNSCSFIDAPLIFIHLQHFIASASHRPSYRPLISYSSCSKLGTYWYMIYTTCVSITSICEYVNGL